jgi:hypothetical protein
VAFSLCKRIHQKPHKGKQNEDAKEGHTKALLLSHTEAKDKS